MELKELAGDHVLTGYDTGAYDTGDKYEPTAARARFVLDGVTYEAQEDPDDGYRSHMRELKVSDEKVANTFPPVRVTCSHRDRGEYDADDVLEIRNAATGAIVLEVGTESVDDYYPSFRNEWHPEALGFPPVEA